MGFCHTGTVTPWSGFTAQVNTSLKRPVRAGCELMLKASVREVDGRKVGNFMLQFDLGPADSCVTISGLG